MRRWTVTARLVILGIVFVLALAFLLVFPEHEGGHDTPAGHARNGHTHSRARLRAISDSGRLYLREAAEPFEAVLKGRVTIEGDNPARGAFVEVSIPGGARMRTTADDDGEYSVHLGSKGRISASAGMPGLLGETKSVLVDKRGEHRLDFVLSREGSIAAEVTDAQTSEPVAGAKAALVDRLTSAVLYELEESGLPGLFTCGGVKSGYYALRVTADEYADHVEPVRFDSGRIKLTVSLVHAARISGEVIDADGRGVGGVKVIAGLTGKETVAEVPDATVRTGPDGAFLLEKIRPGQTYIYACKDGYAPGAAENIELKPGQWLDGLVIVLGRGAAARGRVLDEAGNPVSGARVAFSALCFHSLHPRYVRESTTDEDGGFEVTVLPDADYDVKIRHPEFEPAEFHKAVGIRGSRSVERIHFEIRKGSTIAGAAAGAKGEPAGGVRVIVSRRGGSGLPEEVASGVTGADGAFHIACLKAGTYSLDFWSDDWAHARIDDVRAPSEDVRVTLGRRYSLSGAVTVDGAPAPGLEVLLEKDGMIIRKLTDSDGSFAFSGVEPGTYLLRVLRDGRAIERRSVKVTDGDEEILIRK